MADDIENRLVDLETRLAFQEQALLDLNDALAATRGEAARTAELLARALVDLRQLRLVLHADSGDEPPPPHY